MSQGSGLNRCEWCATEGWGKPSVSLVIARREDPATGRVGSFLGGLLAGQYAGGVADGLITKLWDSQRLRTDSERVWEGIYARADGILKYADVPGLWWWPVVTSLHCVLSPAGAGWIYAWWPCSLQHYIVYWIHYIVYWIHYVSVPLPSIK